MDRVFLVEWAGGDEAPALSAVRTLAEATKVYSELCWLASLPDYVTIYEINLADMSISVITTWDGEVNDEQA
jgi:hypothetical protein